MPMVGLIGNNAGEMALAFLRMCEMAGCKAQRVEMVNMNKNIESDTFYVACIDENIAPDGMDMWVAQEVPLSWGKAAPALKPDAYLLVNADRKEIFRILAPKTAKLITFGFSTKSCVTASSVTEQELQVCIQRGFVSANGRPREPQEFSVPIPAGVSAAAVLGAATACAVYDIV